METTTPMPIYEYRCNKCNAVFEKLVKNSAENPEHCPKCGATQLKKMFSTFSPNVQAGNTADNCPAASQCPTGSCCNGGSCPF